MISLLIPVFNEEGAIEQTVRDAHTALSALDEPFEIVVVDDGSTDDTAKILDDLKKKFEFRNSNFEFHLVKHEENRGYGSSMKTGIRRSNGELIATTDADGTYPIAELPAMIKQLREQRADMVVGARTKKGVRIPLLRRPAKAVVAWLAQSLAGRKIPDVNSGLRVFTRDLAVRYMHLYPEGFSFTITITLAAMTNGFAVEFHPIDYFKRIGVSTLDRGIWKGVRHFVLFLGIVIRIITSFRPLKFFLWPSLLLMLGGLAMVITTVINDRNVSDSGMLLLLTGLQIGLFGLLAEVVIRSQREG